MAIVTKGTPRKYVHKDWPKTLYHQETGQCKTFRSARTVPDDKMWGPKATVGKTPEDLAAAAQEIADAEAEKERLADLEAKELEDEQKKDDKAAKALFKKLKMTREEGEEILREDGIDFDQDADDLTIAKAVKELLDDDDSE